MIKPEYGLVGRTRRRTVEVTVSDFPATYAPNIWKRNFSTTDTNQEWGKDLTYVEADKGWLYLAGNRYLCSRRMVGVGLLMNP